jgi:hypothetical protein
MNKMFQKQVKIDSRLFAILKVKSKTDGTTVSDELNYLMAGALGTAFQDAYAKNESPNTREMLLVLSEIFQEYDQKIRLKLMKKAQKDSDVIH